MRISCPIVVSAFLLSFVSAAAAQQSQPAPTQSPSDQKTQTVSVPTPKQPTVAEAARKAREERKTEPKAAHVFTNDNLPAEGSGINVVGNQTATPAPIVTAPAPSQEKMWRTRFAEARTRLQRDQNELDILQREFGKAELQYYPNDPQKQLMQSVTNQDINDKRAKIDQKHQDVKNDEAAISNLEDDLRKSGGDPGWAR